MNKPLLKIIELPQGNLTLKGIYRKIRFSLTGRKLFRTFKFLMKPISLNDYQRMKNLSPAGEFQTKLLSMDKERSRIGTRGEFCYSYINTGLFHSQFLKTWEKGSKIYFVQLKSAGSGFKAGIFSDYLSGYLEGRFSNFKARDFVPSKLTGEINDFISGLDIPGSMVSGYIGVWDEATRELYLTYPACKEYHYLDTRGGFHKREFNHDMLALGVMDGKMGSGYAHAHLKIPRRAKVILSSSGFLESVRTFPGEEGEGDNHEPLPREEVAGAVIEGAGTRLYNNPNAGFKGWKITPEGCSRGDWPWMMLVLESLFCMEKNDENSDRIKVGPEYGKALASIASIDYTEDENGFTVNNIDTIHPFESSILEIG